jgi:mannose-6-phosphate isomerase-like protein (cupin superfamily)
VSDYQPVTISDKFEKFSDHWSPKIIARMNDYEFKLVRIQGEFVWHSHEDTDETFLILGGSLVLQFRDGEVRLSAGDLFVVPKGVEHRPIAGEECRLMLIEPAGVVNTGDAGGELTAPNGVWI